MSKSLVLQLVEVWAGVFVDACQAFPQHQLGLERDYARLVGIFADRGLFGLAVELPRVCKHFDRCLANGHFVHDPNLVHSACDGSDLFPLFLGELYGEVFSVDGTLKEHPNVEAILFIRQILLLAKKVDQQCSGQAVSETIEAFLETDRELPEPSNGFWDSNDPSEDRVARDFRGFTSFGRSEAGRHFSSTFGEGWELFARYLDFTFGFLVTSLGRYEASEWRFRHGPGAIAAISGPVNKYLWESWPSRLDSRFPISEYGYHSHTSFLRNVTAKLLGETEESSRLCAVAKTIDKPRLIAVEPASHQWCQQNVWHYFCDRTRVAEDGSRGVMDRFLKYRDQTLNQELCRRGSVDGSLATLDLSEASDRVTCDVVGNAFRSNPTLLCSLAACRTRTLRVLGASKDAPAHKLKKFSTMGSACTFPVESILFLGISIASTLFALYPKEHARKAMRTKTVMDLEGKVGVYGDDLIVPVIAWDVVQRALSALHFKVNTAKSYGTGRFRESCGVDAWAGVDVSPVYWRRPMDGRPESVASTLDVRNRFYLRWFRATAEVLDRALRDFQFPSVRPTSGITGFVTFLDPVLPATVKLRRNRRYQRREALLHAFSSVTAKRRTHDDTQLHQFFTERPDPLEFWEAGYAERTSLRLALKWGPIELSLIHI